MENKEKFKSKRWHEDVGARIVGHEETTEDEKNKGKKELENILRERKIIK